MKNLILATILLCLAGCHEDKTHSVNCLNMNNMMFVQGTYHSHDGKPYIEYVDQEGINGYITDANSSNWFCALKEDKDAAPVAQT